MDHESIRLLICDLSRELLEKAKTARIAAANSDYDKGRQYALYEIISLMIQQADAFGIDKATLGLADVDPERDLLGG